MTTYKRNQRRARSEKGAMTSVFFLAVMQVGFVLAALSVDTAHHNAVRAELNAATDAAAIAGEDVFLARGASSTALATAAAQSICNKNYADGRTIGSNKRASINVTIDPGNGSTAMPTVTVQASATVTNMFGVLIGRPNDKIYATSKAGAGAVSTAATPFPMTVVDRNYAVGNTYTWYISDAPGLVPNLVTALSSGLTGSSVGSSPPPYPNSMMGNNTARFITTFNANSGGGLLGAVTGAADGLGGPLGLGSPGTVVGGVLSPTIGTTGSTVTSLLTGIKNASPPTASLGMLSYWNANVSTSEANGQFQNVSVTQPSSNGGAYPKIATNPIAPPSLSVGQQVFLASGADSANNNALNTTAQFLQGSTGNTAIPSSISAYQVTGPGLPSTPTSIQAGSLASWLQNQTVLIPITTPIPASSALTLPILNVNLLGISNSTTATYSTGANGLLGSIVEPLTGVGDATPIAAVVNRFIAVKFKSVTVEYQGAKGINLLGLGVLNDPWAQQVVRITGTVQPSTGFSGTGSSSHVAPGQASAVAAMLIQ